MIHTHCRLLRRVLLGGRQPKGLRAAGGSAGDRRQLQGEGRILKGDSRGVFCFNDLRGGCEMFSLVFAVFATWFRFRASVFVSQFRCVC